MLILDVTCGSRKLYHDWDKKLGDSLIGVDRRRGDFSFKNDSMWSRVEVIVKPTVQADMRFLPFAPRVADGIILDPPHLNVSSDTFMAKAYGSWSQHEMISTLRFVNVEFQRVLKQEGWLVLKVLPRAFPFYESLLKNFLFFLPIQTKRQQGSYGKKVIDKDAAFFALGYCKGGDDAYTERTHQESV